MAESTQRLSDYEKSQARYQELLGGSSKFKNMVEQQVKEKTNFNKDLISQQQRLIENQLSLPSQLRSEFSGGPIRDPLAQEALIQQRSSNVGQQIGTVGNLLAARNQNQSDIMQKALESYQSRLQGEGTASENAWRLYQDALAREQAARARAAAAQPAFDLSSLFKTQETNPFTPVQVAETPAITQSPYWNQLSEAAQWEPQNKGLADVYNKLTNTVGKFVYENPSPISYIRNLFNRNK